MHAKAYARGRAYQMRRFAAKMPVAALMTLMSVSHHILPAKYEAPSFLPFVNGQRRRRKQLKTRFTPYVDMEKAMPAARQFGERLDSVVLPDMLLNLSKSDHYCASREVFSSIGMDIECASQAADMQMHEQPARVTPL